MAEEQTNGNGASTEVPANLSAQLRALESDILLARTQWMKQVGIAFDGSRDYYSVFGYDRLLTARQYRETYSRGGIAKRIVEAFPKATWRGGVEIFEDEDPEKKTAFEKTFDELNNRLRIWSVLERADILASLSTYSVILLGAPGAFAEPLPKSNGNPAQLAYLTPFWGGGGPTTGWQGTTTAEVDATIASYVENKEDPRFGEPEFYALKRTNIQIPTEMNRVHWTRIIHVAEGCLDDNVFGIPVLENVWNLLQDLLKCTGGGAEAFWLRANQGMHINLDKDMALAEGDKTLDKLKEDLEKYKHGLTRWIRTRGVDVNTLGSDVANFGPSADAILKQIAGSKGIPLRILTGSEMGQLASGQDADNWNTQVQDRRTSYAGPSIVRRLVDRLIEFGYLPKPAQYTVGWPVEEEMSEPQKADLATKLAQANATMGEPLFTEAEIREKTFDMKPLTDGQRKEITDRSAEKLKQQQEAMGGQPQPAPDNKKVPPQLMKAAAEYQPQPGDEELIRILAEALEAGNAEVVGQIVGLGDVSGHEFHGNQWTEGNGGHPLDKKVIIKDIATRDEAERLAAVLRNEGRRAGDATKARAKRSVDPLVEGTLKDKQGKPYRVLWSEPTDAQGHVRTTYSIHDDDRVVGKVELTRGLNSVIDVQIDPDYRRRGLATALYDYVENDLGVTLKPNAIQTPEGKAFRRSRIKTLGDLAAIGIVPVHKMNSGYALCGQPTTEAQLTTDDEDVTCVKCLEVLRG